MVLRQNDNIESRGLAFHVSVLGFIFVPYIVPKALPGVIPEYQSVSPKTNIQTIIKLKVLMLYSNTSRNWWWEIG